LSFQERKPTSKDRQRRRFSERTRRLIKRKDSGKEARKALLLSSSSSSRSDRDEPAGWECGSSSSPSISLCDDSSSSSSRPRASGFHRENVRLAIVHRDVIQLFFSLLRERGALGIKQLRVRTPNRQRRGGMRAERTECRLVAVEVVERAL